MSYELLTNILLLIHIVILCYVIIGSAQLIPKSNASLLTVFFTFSMVSYLMSNLYWLAYTALRQDARMPFAANEMGEWATILLLAAALSSIVNKIPTIPISQIIFVWLLTVANVALWIAWSGEWLQDIITGLVMGYFLCTAVHAEYQTRSFTRKELCYLCSTFVIAVVLQTSIFFVSDIIGTYINTISYIVMLICIVFLYAKNLLAIKSHINTKAKLTLLFITFSSTITFLWMSDGIFYTIFLVSNMMLLPLMLEALKQEVLNI